MQKAHGEPWPALACQNPEMKIQIFLFSFYCGLDDTCLLITRKNGMVNHVYFQDNTFISW